MNQTPSYHLFAGPFLAWTDFVLLSTQMLMSSAQAIGYRTSHMLLAGDTPDVRDEQEFDDLGEEQASAAVASTQAIAQGMFELGQELAVMAGRQMLTGLPLMMSLATSDTPQQSMVRQSNLAKATQDDVEKANERIAASIPGSARKNLTPAHRPAGANRKRLAKHAAARVVRNKTGAHHSR
ncbi:MAG: hypothetical protein ABI619_04530 [Betaproteobacteria bacterium]